MQVRCDEGLKTKISHLDLNTESVLGLYYRPALKGSGSLGTQLSKSKYCERVRLLIRLGTKELPKEYFVYA